VLTSATGDAMAEVGGTAARMERTLELAGDERLPSAHWLCVHRGDPGGRFEGDWE